MRWAGRAASRSPSRRLDLAALGTLVFQQPAHDRFPALNLAIGSMRSGGLAPTVLNAANEIAVQAFLDRRIGFLDIPRVVERHAGRDFARQWRRRRSGIVFSARTRGRACWPRKSANGWERKCTFWMPCAA